MRWVLEYRLDENENKSPKARIVIPTSRIDLQGRRPQRDLWVLPVPERTPALNAALGEIMKLKKAAYGLVEAPVEWYISISTALEEHGWRRLKSDPCCWILIDPGLVKTTTHKE